MADALLSVGHELAFHSYYVFCVASAPCTFKGDITHLTVGRYGDGLELRTDVKYRRYLVWVATAAATFHTLLGRLAPCFHSMGGLWGVHEGVEFGPYGTRSCHVAPSESYAFLVFFLHCYSYSSTSPQRRKSVSTNN